jgi:hypothetical protein
MRISGVRLDILTWMITALSLLDFELAMMPLNEVHFHAFFRQKE